MIESQTTKIVKPEQVFSRIASQNGAVWLDSSMRIGDKGRYSIIARNPVDEISTNIDGIDESLKKIEKLCIEKKLFAIGFLSYETGLHFLDLDVKNPPNLPILNFFFYKSVMQFDNETGGCVVTDQIVDDYSDLLENSIDSSSQRNSIAPKLTETVPKEVYLRRVKRIKEHIKEGDIYQANYTCRFDIESNVDPFDVYSNLRKLNPAPYAAYLNFGDYKILSSSPERMFKKEGDTITSCPIKGTVPSGSNEIEQKLQRTKLLNSVKDKAELLMIVDLMRNDIGRIAQTGTVSVNNLFNSEIYSSVIHLVADVSARLKKNTTLTQICKALIPGGSITGAPKRRAVEILQMFESTPRGVYTGCIGYINGNKAEFNISIRTIVHKDDIYHVYAGGGIVADSDPESEYNEMQLKAGNLFKALGVTEVK